jgi:hypothetical protein
METLSTDEVLQQFAQKLLEEQKLEVDDAEVLAQIKADLVDRLEDRMNMIILKHMPEDQLAAFEELLDNGSAEVLQKFCQTTIPDLQNILAAELMAFRKTYLGLE